ncbi:Bax inhibitor-1/YccA family protein [Bacteriovorax sp. Seq25_V]|uniref:Bax inhibitor-1/YccA family protein n=1 Tax=Bacteriovorax sp. Seq25_V TaxID=1201288 RepID=UPI000389F2CA|nr:Bax inhibitor-1/YccA family protein [Bacteriovorax sp. Seq25_V]EQC47415.1 inhibitor of apoptosis-promoting Bax1 [Bacteriovorax sp. Seq25_V]
MSQGNILRSEQSIAEETARFMSGVYKWMSFGILLTGFISYYIASSPNLIMAIVTNKILFYGLIIAQLGAVFYLSLMVKKISAMTATLVYLLYASLTGVTLSTIFLVYTQDSISNAFFVTCFSFAGLSAFGYVTKKDLGPIGTFCHMGLWGLIGFGLLSMFFPSMFGSSLQMVYSICGIVIFAGLTAYDTQKIKSMNIIGNEGTEEDHKETIIGALTLYLDFINLFLMILRLMGNRRK